MLGSAEARTLPGRQSHAAEGNDQCADQACGPDGMPDRCRLTSKRGGNAEGNRKDDRRLDQNNDHLTPPFFALSMSLPRRLSSSSESFPPPSSVAIIFSAEPS